MKQHVPFTLAIAVFGALVASVSAAETPKPRLKLLREGSGTITGPEGKPTSPDEPVTLEKVEVSESKLPAPPRQLSEEDRSRFSIVDGGPFYTTKKGKFEISIGIWRHAEVFKEDAAFKAPKMQAEFDLLRIKW